MQMQSAGTRSPAAAVARAASGSPAAPLLRPIIAIVACCGLGYVVKTEAKVTIGINLSGMEEGGKVPGKPYFDFAVPSEAEYAYFASKGLKLVRLPFKWERLQPVAGEALASDYLKLLHTQIQLATNYSMTVIIDNHGFGSGYGAKLNGDSTSNSNFADLWRRLAVEFKGNSAVAGYDIMNEPNNMPSTSAWHKAAQAAIDVIRTVDTETPLYIEGNHWSGAANWSANNPTLHTLDDHLCSNHGFPSGKGCIVWSAHCYLDSDNSGTHFNWTEQVETGVTVHIGVDRLRDFASWLKSHDFKRAHIGELGAGRDNIGWLMSLNNSLAFMDENDWELTYWSAGPWFSGKYPYDVDAKTIYTNCSAEQQAKKDKRCTKVPQDAVQMAVLSQWSGAAPPNEYFLNGPATGPTEAPSAPFTLLYRGYITKPITFRCFAVVENEDSSADLLTHTCPVGWNNCEANFTVTATKSQNHTVKCTNNGSLQDAVGLAYSSSSDMFLGAAAPAANVFSLRKIYSGYNGPALTLRRSIDNNTLNATFRSKDGELDTAAIASWCSEPCLAFVAVWFDQSPNQWHAGMLNPKTDFHGDGNHNVSIADQPQLVLSSSNDGTHVAHIHFDGTRRMDAKSPIDGNTGQTLLAVFQTDSHSGNTGNSTDRLLSWAMVQNLVFPQAGGYVTPDSKLSLSMNISDSPGCARIAATH
jgi:endoglucanase